MICSQIYVCEPIKHSLYRGPWARILAWRGPQMAGLSRVIAAANWSIRGSCGATLDLRVEDFCYGLWRYCMTFRIEAADSELERFAERPFAPTSRSSPAYLVVSKSTNS